MQNRIDHIAIGAESLDQGCAALREALGGDVPRGGKHPAMSTHNCVAQAGRDCFLEVIAVDPDAPDPGRVRWFTLDDPGTRIRLAERPRALCWVVGTDDLETIVANSPVDLGEAVALSRGELSWRLTVPKDGSLPEGGLLPAFIQWPPGVHPSAGMPDLGLTLKAVRLTHPDPGHIAHLLEALRVAHLAELVEGPPGIAFAMETPRGEVVLD